MTIVEAINKTVLQPVRLHNSREAFKAIVGQGLHQSQTKHPHHDVLVQIRRHCVDFDFLTASLAKHVNLRGEYTYTSLEHPIRQFDVIAGEIGQLGKNKKRALLEKNI